MANTQSPDASRNAEHQRTTSSSTRRGVAAAISRIRAAMVTDPGDDDVVKREVPDEKKLDLTSEPSHPALGLTRAEYMRKQDRLFKELTGMDSFKDVRRDEHIDDIHDPLLMRVLETYAMAADQDIFDDVNHQRHVMDEIEEMQNIAFQSVYDMESDEKRIRALAFNLGQMRSEMAKLEVKFLQMQQSRTLTEKQLVAYRDGYRLELLQRLQLEEVCRILRNRLDHAGKSIAAEQQDAVSSRAPEKQAHSEPSRQETSQLASIEAESASKVSMASSAPSKPTTEKSVGEPAKLQKSTTEKTMEEPKTKSDIDPSKRQKDEVSHEITSQLNCRIQQTNSRTLPSRRTEKSGSSWPATY